MKCATCSGALTGQQRKFCSLKCKNADTNLRNQNYEAQQARGMARKKKLVEMAGGKCSECNYRKNYAGLCFHHTGEEAKEFGITLRECSNNSWDVLLKEAAKCVLLCQNCHMELHHPDLAISEEDGSDGWTRTSDLRIMSATL